eukprot:228435-Lingulodinium_polyedra.AAC.1
MKEETRKEASGKITVELKSVPAVIGFLNKVGYQADENTFKNDLKHNEFTSSGREVYKAVFQQHILQAAAQARLQEGKALPFEASQVPHLCHVDFWSSMQEYLA